MKLKITEIDYGSYSNNDGYPKGTKKKIRVAQPMKYIMKTKPNGLILMQDPDRVVYKVSETVGIILKRLKHTTVYKQHP